MISYFQSVLKVVPPNNQILPEASSHNAAPYKAGGVFVGDDTPFTPNDPVEFGVLLPFIHVHSPI
jgi:hypothetical protein